MLRAMIVDDEAPARSELRFLLEQEAKLRASRRLIIHNHRTQHRDKTFRQLTTPGIRRMTLSP